MLQNDTKLSWKQDRAIQALLQEPTIEAAAGAASVSRVTIFRWLNQPEFKTRYLAARRQVVDTAIAELQRHTGDAVQTLVRNMTSGTPHVEVRAALGVLDQAIKGVEVAELEERIGRIEELLREMQQRDDHGDGRVAVRITRGSYA
jgi:hypothetical protein